MHSFLRTFAPPPPSIRGRALPSPPLACSSGGRPGNTGPAVKGLEPTFDLTRTAQVHEPKVRVTSKPFPVQTHAAVVRSGHGEQQRVPRDESRPPGLSLRPPEKMFAPDARERPAAGAPDHEGGRQGGPHDGSRARPDDVAHLFVAGV